MARNPVTVQGVASIPANSANQNVLADSRIVQAPFTGRIKLWTQGDGTVGDLTMNFKVAADEVVVDSPVADSGTVPKTNEDVTASGVVVMAGERLTLSCSNSTGGALNFLYRVIISPVRRTAR